MKLLLLVSGGALMAQFRTILAYSVPRLSTDAAKSALDMDRRTWLGGVLTAVLGSSPVLSSAAAAAAAEEAVVPNEEAVYFGVGCFWHIQHEFVVAERELLGRSDRELTSLTGYAGGKSTDNFNRVCYHNFQQVADYGKLGHGEVVGMQIPSEKIVDFAAVYFSLFNPKTLGKPGDVDLVALHM
jgi:hypothetical protein